MRVHPWHYLANHQCYMCRETDTKTVLIRSGVMTGIRLCYPCWDDVRSEHIYQLYPWADRGAAASSPKELSAIAELSEGKRVPPPYVQLDLFA